MPIYAYRCERCGHAKDVLQKVSDPVLTVCPACGEPTFRKQVTAAGFQLKGSGWYVTDFRDKPGGKPGESGAGDAKPADAKSADTKGGDAPADTGASTNGSADGGKTAKSEAPAAAPASAPTPAAPPAASGGTGGSRQP